MKQDIPIEFGKAVRAAFARTLELSKLELRETPEGVYEIASDYLSLCIRWQVGHGGNAILATLSPPSRRWPATKDCRTGELGLEHAVEFYAAGALAKALHFKTQKCGETAAELSDVLADCALAVEKCCIPLLLGLNNDWLKIQNVWQKKSESHS